MKALFSLVILLFSLPSHAHVKWFSDYDFTQSPLDWSAVNSPVLWGLFALSILSLPLMVWLDRIGEKNVAYQRVNSFLDRYQGEGPLIMRITMGAVLLMSWQGDSVIAPDIAISSPYWGWFQFLLALGLLFKETSIFSGLGIVFLYFVGIKEHGIFHMLDYVIYPSAGLYLIFTHLKNVRLKNLDLPVLYSGLGFSLCWVAFEKIFYPFWGLSVIAKAPALTMGLPHDFFLLSCAFVEFTLGYLLIICLLHRPLALVITLVFFITTSFFGKTEVVGHTILHGALLVFIVRGPGHHYQAPIRFHDSLVMRNLFAIVNFILLFFIMGIPYEKMAKVVHAKTMKTRALAAHPKIELGEAYPKMSVMIHPSKDSSGGWNLHLMTENFTFSPQNAGRDDVIGEGHAHIYVDGKKIGRVYAPWTHVTLPKGEHKVKITLNTNTHKDYVQNGEAVQAEVTLSEERGSAATHNH